MDRQQFVDQITAIDLQIGRLRDHTKTLERDIAMRHAPGYEQDQQQQRARYVDEIASLVEQKRALRARILEI